MKPGQIILSVLGVSLFGVGAHAQGLDPALPAYKPVSGISGNLKSVGSDTLNNLMTFWAEGFRRFYPGVKMEIEGKGSATAPPALIAGAAQFGPMSRTMKASESEQFEKQFGYKATKIRVAIDALAVFVSKDNPVKCLTLSQVDAIFSKSRRGGLNKDIKTWGDLGLVGAWKDQVISIYGRNSASGTYGYFKEEALFNGDYKDTVKEQPGSSAVVQSVASDRFAIGYSGIGYKTADVRAVPLATKAGESCQEASAENAYSGDYPLARFLYIYVNADPTRKLDPLRGEFIKYIQSKEGQQETIKDGYFPLTKITVDEDMRTKGLYK